MSNHPFDQIAHSLGDQITEIKRQIEENESALRWNETFNRAKTCDDMFELERQMAGLESELVAESTIIQENKSQIRELEKNIGTMFNPFNWFDAEQTKLRQERSNRNDLIRHKNKSIETLNKKLRKLKDQRTSLEADLKRYDSFNRDAVIHLLESLSESLDCLQDRLAFNARRKASFDKVAGPIESEIARLQRELAAQESVLAAANDFKQRLSYAPSKRDRALIHEDCESTLGDGSPDRIIGKTQGSVRRLQQDLDKYRSRLDRILRTCSRPIDHLVIDGNNLCYESGTNRPVGLSAIFAVLPELASISQVTIVFDNSINHMMRGDFFHFKRQLEDHARVHVVPTRHVADDTVLDLAENESTWVISNDRYAEYREKSAVRAERLIRHEIINGMVFIRELLISSEYASY